ncbi:MAG TPA: TetR/AcrR family transcriptional regulator [Thermoanaerobaculia bacterium]|nr:TetR/AcrR family transcriptional regulator [Thermoanaerobaculia bacterium]
MARTRTEAKRAVILRAATDVFARKGFHDVLTEEIAREAGVGKGTLYRYFQTKDDLYYAAVLAGFDEMDTVLADPKLGGRSPAETLALVAREVLRVFWNRPSFTMISHRDGRRLRVREQEVQSRRDALVRFVRETLVRGAARGDFRPVEPRTGAELFLGMVRGALLYRQAADTPGGLSRAVCGTFVHGISRKKESS